jgi:hypothetical protein
VDVDSDGEEELMSALLRTLHAHAPASLPVPLPKRLPPTVIFAPTRSSCERIASFLCSSGIFAVALHGGCSMQHVLQQQLLLQKRDISCIGTRPEPALSFVSPCPAVATDAMSRGLDWGGGGGLGLVIECPLAENAGERACE